jgi:hypothetical protein
MTQLRFEPSGAHAHVFKLAMRTYTDTLQSCQGSNAKRPPIGMVQLTYWSSGDEKFIVRRDRRVVDCAIVYNWLDNSALNAEHQIN